MAKTRLSGSGFEGWQIFDFGYLRSGFGFEGIPGVAARPEVDRLVRDAPAFEGALVHALILRIGFWVSGEGFRVSGFGLRVSGFGFQVSGFWLRVSCFLIRISGFRFRVLGFGSRSSSFWFWDFCTHSQDTNL